VKSVGLALIGGSAGSLTPILTILSNLSPRFNLPLVIVLHRKNSYDNALSDLLSQKTKIPVKEIEDKDPILPGVVYIAPADYHLLIEREKIFSLDVSERINYSRPSIDVTCESAALSYEENLVAILLSGANSDGSLGLKSVQDLGGTVIVQDPATAEVPFMPQAAISKLPVNYILKPAEISEFLNTQITAQ
jgi:two-component system, chemotaxis family, protein-glutamate methylesterase/glutaminase